MIYDYLGSLKFNKRGICLLDDNGVILKTDDVGLIQTSVDKTVAEQKLYQIEIDGADGNIDLTDTTFGGAFFKTATSVYTYCLDGLYHNRSKTLQKIYNQIHGRKLYTIECDNLDYYYSGRITAKITHQKGYSELVITAINQPYRMKKPLEISVDADMGSVTLDIQSGRKFVVPKFSSVKEHTITFSGTDYIIPDNSNNLIIPSIVFENGINKLVVNKTECRQSKYYTWEEITKRHTIEDISNLYPLISDLSGIEIIAIIGCDFNFYTLQKKQWCNLRHIITGENEINENLKINYEWGDL